MKLANRWRELADAPFQACPDFKAADRLVERGHRAFHGERRARDVRDALRCYRAAAEAGHLYAWTNLALCHLKGDGVARNLRKHFECFEHAARLGHDRAKLRVACALIDGCGVKRDTNAGRAMLERLARGGDEHACFELAERLDSGLGLRKCARASSRWRRYGAGRGWAACENALGVHAYEQGTERGKREAVRWYRRAARHGSAFAENNLSRCYEEGDGVARSEPMALRWLLEAVETNSWSDDPDETAWIRLAQRHFDGCGVRKDRRKAERFLELAEREQSSLESTRLLREVRQQRKRATRARR